MSTPRLDQYDRNTLKYLRGCGCDASLVARVESLVIERNNALKDVDEVARILRNLAGHLDNGNCVTGAHQNKAKRHDG